MGAVPGGSGASGRAVRNGTRRGGSERGWGGPWPGSRARGLSRRDRGRQATGRGIGAQHLSPISRPGNGGGADSTCFVASIPWAPGKDGRMGRGARRESGLREAFELPAFYLDVHLRARVESHLTPV